MRRFQLHSKYQAAKVGIALATSTLLPMLGTVMVLIGIAVPFAVGTAMGLGKMVTVSLSLIVSFVCIAMVQKVSVFGKTLVSKLPERFVLSMGADGMALRRLFKTTFVPWNDIASVTSRKRDILIVALRSGEQRYILVADNGEAAVCATEFLNAWSSRVAGLRIPELNDASEFSRWVAQAKGLLAEEGGFRDAQREPNSLATIIGDPTAPTAQRLGVALALSKGPEPVRTKVRIALEEMADQNMADAIDDALNGNAQALKKVLS